ncbi:hypothetical protein SGPA1_11861 [Streptomyces misionensis JCM 4497]
MHARRRAAAPGTRTADRDLPGVPGGRDAPGAAAALPDLRARRLLRLLAGPARHRAPREVRSSGDADLRTGRGLAVVLRRPRAGLNRERAARRTGSASRPLIVFPSDHLLV